MVVTTTYHQSLQTGSRLVHQGHNCADGLSYIGSCLEPHQSEGGSSRRIGCSLQIWNTITLCLFDKMQIHCLIFGMARVRDGPIVCWLNVTWSSICFWKSRTHPRLGIFLLKKASRCAHFFPLLMWKAMLETEKADGDKDVKSGLTHLVQFPLIKNDVRSRYISLIW